MHINHADWLIFLDQLHNLCRQDLNGISILCARIGTIHIHAIRCGPLVQLNGLLIGMRYKNDASRLWFKPFQQLLRTLESGGFIPVRAGQQENCRPLLPRVHDVTLCLTCKPLSQEKGRM